jgi:membrane dipeptidase
VRHHVVTSETVSPVQLSASDDDRARQLHRDAVVFICHDHSLLPEDMDAMRRGGVHAKQLMLSVDGRVHADRETFLASGRGRSYARETRRQEAPVAADAESGPVRALSVLESEGFLKAALIAMDYVYWQVEGSNGKLRIALEPADIPAAKKEGAIALVLGSEGSRLIEDSLPVLRMLARMGLRHLQLSWALETTVGAPQSDTSGRGLTAFGRELIRELNRLGVIVDVSHLAAQSQYDALAESGSPVLNSHTGASALNMTQPQLLDDDLIRAFAARGGVMAMHFLSQVVKPGRDQARFEQLMDQFEYVAKLAGTDHVACGPDFIETRDKRLWENQGITVPFKMTAGVEDISRLLNVTRGLVSRGFSDDDIKKMLGGNLLRVFELTRAGRSEERPPYPRPEGFGVLTGGTTAL